MKSQQVLAMDFPQMFDDRVFPQERPITASTIARLVGLGARARPCPICGSPAAWSSGDVAFSICCARCQCFHFHSSAGPVVATLSPQAREQLSAALAAASIDEPAIVAVDSIERLIDIGEHPI